LLLGIIAAIGLAVCTPVWMLAQMGRPIDFSGLWLVVGIPVLVLALFIVKTRTVIAAVVCGVLFSAPIAAYFWILSSAEPRLDYFHNMRSDGILTVIGTIVLMIVATFHRRLNPPAANDDDPG
jgi:glucose dehydrogenase